MIHSHKLSIWKSWLIIIFLSNSVLCLLNHLRTEAKHTDNLKLRNFQGNLLLLSEQFIMSLSETLIWCIVYVKSILRFSFILQWSECMVVTKRSRIQFPGLPPWKIFKNVMSEIEWATSSAMSTIGQLFD